MDTNDIMGQAQAAMGNVMGDPAGWWENTGQQMVTDLGISLITAVLIFVIGRWVARQIQKLIRKIMEKARVDEALIGFTTGLVYAALMAFVVLAALGKLGVQTTSFVAIIGAAGLAVGLALQGSLANFAAGVLMLIFRPFKIGDFVEGGGTSGVVKAISIFTTTLTTPDNKRIIVPNSGMMGGNIINYSVEPTRRVDLVACIGYGDDIDKAKEVLQGIVEADERVLKDPAPTIAVVTMNDSSIDLVVRPWVNSGDYWPAYFALTEAIKKGLEAAGMNIPYPQRDIHVYNHDA